MVLVGINFPPRNFVMAFALSLSIPASLASPESSFSSVNAVSVTRCNQIFLRRSNTSRRKRFIVKASDGDEDEKPAFNPFGFVTDNPSSRSAIQLPESPAEDGNVGQMLYVSYSESTESVAL